jgi:hypothetical protein
MMRMCCEIEVLRAGRGAAPVLFFFFFFANVVAQLLFFSL